MAIKDISELKEQSDSTFATNGQGQITAEGHRAFNEDLLDSVALKTVWLDVAPDLNASSISVSNNISIKTCFVKRTGSIVSMLISGALTMSPNISIGNPTFTFTLDSSVFSLGDALLQVGTFKTTAGNIFVLLCGSETIQFELTSYSSVTKDTFVISAVFPALIVSEVIPGDDGGDGGLEEVEL